MLLRLFADGDDLRLLALHLGSGELEQVGVVAACQSAVARAYTSNILSIAYGNPLVDILVAVLPCAWVYADYGQRLAAEFADTLDTNPYKSWVDMYKTEEFWSSSAWLIEHVEQLVEGLNEERRAELVDIFVTGVQNEYMFWSSAYDMQYTWKPEWDV